MLLKFFFKISYIKVILKIENKQYFLYLYLKELFYIKVSKYRIIN